MNVSTSWTSERTRSLIAEVETEDCIIEVTLRVTSSTPKSITQRQKGRRHYISATVGEPTETSLLTLSSSPVEEPYQIVYKGLLPTGGIKAWLRDRQLESYFEAVLRTAFRLQAQLENPDTE